MDNHCEETKIMAIRLGPVGKINLHRKILALSQPVRKMNLFGFKIDFAKYSEEIGGYAGELEDKRTSLQVSLIF